jgi:hypothetical protein
VTKHAGLAMHRQVMYLKPRPPKARAKPMFTALPPARKRGGARYGPPPKNPPHERMQAPERMAAVVRADNYGNDGRGRLTSRQERQLYRMALRAGANIGRGIDAKGRATPKRGCRD